MGLDSIAKEGLEMPSSRSDHDGWWEDPIPESALKKYQSVTGSMYQASLWRSVSRLMPRAYDKNSTAVDYGCGGGNGTLLMARAGYKVIAADASEHSLAACRLNLQLNGMGEGVSYVLCRAPDYWKNIPGNLDLILAKDVVEHVAEDARFFQDAAQRLKIGGTLVVVTQNDQSLNYCLEAPRRLAKDPDWCGWHPSEHKRFYNRARLDGLVRCVGLEAKEWRSSYLVPYMCWTSWVMVKLRNALYKTHLQRLLILPDRLLGRLWPFNSLGWSIQVRAVRIR